MHAIVEIIMPPTGDVEGAIEKIMAGYDENGGDEENGPSKHAFWDFYVIGGRFAGAKLKSSLGNEKISKFYKVLRDAKVTVSGFTAGKQELQPASQIPAVDAMWREFFPDSGIDVCPLFKHSNDQYDSGSLLVGDICTLAELPPEHKAERVLFGGWNDDGELTAKYMLSDTMWNCTNHQKTAWDGVIMSAVNEYTASLDGYKKEYKEKNSPKHDWLVVTVDYHS